MGSNISDRTGAYVAWGDEDKICAVTVARRVCGAQVAEKLRAAFAGTDLYIPAHPSKDHELSKAIGWDAACAISAEIGQTISYVAKNDYPRLVMLESVIMWARLAGLRNRAIASLVDRTDRHIREIAAGLRQAGRLPKASLNQHG